MTFRKTITLKTGENILLEQIRGKEKAKEFQAYINPIILEQSFLLMEKPVKLGEERQWLREQIKSNKEGTVIYLKALFNGKLIGGCEARRGLQKEKDNAELGIAISKNWRGKGLGRQLLTELIFLVKRKWNPRNIYLGVFQNNDNARKFYKSLGFTILAKFPKWINHSGTYEDKLILVLQR